MTKFPALAALLLIAGLDRAAAQQLEPRPVPTGEVESFTYQSPSMGVRYAVNVGLPAGYKPGDGKKYPAIVTTDGDWTFPGFNAMVRMLDGTIAPIFVVSIGAPVSEGRDSHTRRRIYEFSPTDWDRQDPMGQNLTEICGKMHSEPGRCTGGAPKFLNAIVSELIPIVTAKYPIDATDLGLFGLSAGGFFASWAIFQPTSPFKKYLISSPGMGYGDGDIFRQEARYAKDHKDLAVRIYLGAGTLEASDPYIEGIGRVVSGMSHFAGVLASRNYPGLKVVTEYHPGLGHLDVMGTTVSRGLRVLYGK